MPTVFRHRNYRFYFFSNEGDPLEPLHVHVNSADGEAKLWLYPEVKVAHSVGYSRSQISGLIRLVREHRREIERAWHEHFKQGCEPIPPRK